MNYEVVSIDLVFGFQKGWIVKIVSIAVVCVWFSKNCENCVRIVFIDLVFEFQKYPLMLCLDFKKKEYLQILLTSRSDRCDLLLNGGVQIEVWSSVVNPRRMFTNAYMNQFLKQALDSKIASSVECVINRVMTFLILTRKSSKLTWICNFDTKN